ncbi:MAG: nucleotidyltransferase domain-containing protein [Candidatus Woesearchaeota archaeon]
MVNINKHKLTLLQQEILKLLYKKAGLSLNQRQIAKSLNVSSPAVLKALPILKKLNYIIYEKDKETGRVSIKLNLENRDIINYKRAENLKQIYESGLFDCLEKEFPGSTIILFGSYSRGDDLVNSDIDIAVINTEEKKINLSKFEKVLERKINLNFFDSFQNINKYLKENLANGILLAGGFVFN